MPVSKEVTVPFNNHRYIIGQKGESIRQMMDEFDVNIAVPPPERQEDIIVVTGPVKNVERAIEALHKRNEEIEAQSEDRKLRSFQMVMTVPNQYHSKIIGKIFVLR